MKRAVIFAAAATVLICVWLGVWHVSTDGPGSAMRFAQILAQIQKAKTISVEDDHLHVHLYGREERKWIKAEEESCLQDRRMYTGR